MKAPGRIPNHDYTAPQRPHRCAAGRSDSRSLSRLTALRPRLGRVPCPHSPTPDPARRCPGHVWPCRVPATHWARRAYPPVLFGRRKAARTASVRFSPARIFVASLPPLPSACSEVRLGRAFVLASGNQSPEAQRMLSAPAGNAAACVAQARGHGAAGAPKFRGPGFRDEQSAGGRERPVWAEERGVARLRRHTGGDTGPARVVLLPAPAHRARVLWARRSRSSNGWLGPAWWRR